MFMCIENLVFFLYERVTVRVFVYTFVCLFLFFWTAPHSTELLWLSKPSCLLFHVFGKNRLKYIWYDFKICLAFIILSSTMHHIFYYEVSYISQKSTMASIWGISKNTLQKCVFLVKKRTVLVKKIRSLVTINENYKI